MAEASTGSGIVAYIRRGPSSAAPGEASQRRALQRWAGREGARIAQWHVEEDGPSDLAGRPALMVALSSLAGSGSRVLCVSAPEVLDDAPWARLVVEHL
ncbi:MAG: hypothetical protein ACLP1X_16940 [Polyangiaceae bacterium]|jgi:hypothetical protein